MQFILKHHILITFIHNFIITKELQYHKSLLTYSNLNSLVSLRILIIYKPELHYKRNTIYIFI